MDPALSVGVDGQPMGSTNGLGGNNNIFANGNNPLGNLPL